MIGCLQSALASFDLCIRGAICYGELYFNNEFIFGKGLIEAYKLESKISIFPRIIIDDSFITEILNIETKNQNLHINLKELPYIQDCYIIDFDNNKIVNYLGIMKMYKDYEYKIGSLFDFNKVLENNRKFINDNINMKHMKHIEQKYQWCKNYHNNFCKTNNYLDFIID